MCVIIYKPFDKQLSMERLQEAHKANPDGCGFMWAANGELHIAKGCGDFMTFHFPYLYFTMKNPKSDFVLHFRTASASDISHEACHPFYINDNLGFAHNGNLIEFAKYFGKGRNDNRSDTQAFRDQILKKFPQDFLSIPEIRDLLEQYCRESYSKMVFMDAQGKVTIINEQGGYWEDGVWYSNGGIKNYSGYGYSGAYYYNAGDVRHKGGLIGVQMFSKDRRAKWQQCKMCLGWHPKEKVIDGYCSGCRTLRRLKEIIDK